MVGVLCVPSFGTLDGYDTATMIVLFMIILVYFAILFIVNSIGRFLLHYQYRQKCSETLGGKALYTQVRGGGGGYAGNQSTMGFVARFVPGTISIFWLRLLRRGSKINRKD